MEYFLGTVVWYDDITHEAAILIDGRSHTTLVYGVTGLVPGQAIVVYADGTVYNPGAVS